MAAIDRQRVRHSFEQHAAEYDDFARVQKRVVERFLTFASEGGRAPGRLLDVGAGTGILLQALAARFPAAEMIGLDMAYHMGATARSRLAGIPRIQFVTADAEQLPFPGGTFDRVVSTSTFQWLDNLDAAFSEAYRVLRPRGEFAFALFGEKTLLELRDSYRAACTLLERGGGDRPQRFSGSDDVIASLAKAGFESCETLAELEIETHPDVPALLRSIRRIGAGNPAPVAARGLSERRVMMEMMTIYRDTYGRGGYIPATYEVIYGKGIKM